MFNTHPLVEWISEDPTRSEREHVSMPKSGPRKVHTKSRHGCLNCKKRRAKVKLISEYQSFNSDVWQCNEAKPECSRCFDLRLQCTFPGNADTPKDNIRTTMSEEVSISRPEIHDTRARIMSDLKEHEISFPSIPASIYEPHEVLDHFLETKTPWLGSPDLQRVMQKHALRLSPEAPYLLHAILAFSATHLNYLCPHEKKYTIAAASHLERSLNLFTSQLEIRIDDSNRDTIYACSYLHSMLAFRNVYLTSMEHSYIPDSTGALALGWLGAMQGPRVLRQHSFHHAASIWAPVCLEGQSLDPYMCSHSHAQDMNLAIGRISTELHRLCGVDLDLGSYDPIPNNPFQEPLRLLCQLLHCDIGHNVIGMFMMFIGKLPAAFGQLLNNDDPRAMLIMAYWCWLILQIDQWWLRASAEVEYARFCAMINKLGDERVRRLLPLLPDNQNLEPLS